MFNNCEKCGRSYAPYKTGKEEDCGALNCEIPVFENGEKKKAKGVCQFCNPKSVFYLDPEKCYNYKTDTCMCGRESGFRNQIRPKHV